MKIAKNIDINAALMLAEAELDNGAIRAPKHEHEVYVIRRVSPDTSNEVGIDRLQKMIDIWTDRYIRTDSADALATVEYLEQEMQGLRSMPTAQEFIAIRREVREGKRPWSDLAEITTNDKSLTLDFSPNPAVVCAWCECGLKAGTYPQSHGICLSCEKDSFDRLEFEAGWPQNKARLFEQKEGK